MSFAFVTCQQKKDHVDPRFIMLVVFKTAEAAF